MPIVMRRIGTKIRSNQEPSGNCSDELIRKPAKVCRPELTKRQILSIAYFLILEENNALNRFSHWQQLHIHPNSADIPSKRSSELFQSISEEGRMVFFQKQGRRSIEREYWAFDITSISSYSDVLCQVKKGRNKEYDRLPQINLGLRTGTNV